jgi:hypothetical protein
VQLTNLFLKVHSRKQVVENLAGDLHKGEVTCVDRGEDGLVFSAALQGEVVVA